MSNGTSTRPSLQYFGTSGIRGRTLIDITPSLAERMARAYVNVVLKNKTEPKVVIGHDPRYGAEIIELSIIVGLTACGVSVIRCGIVPTPVLLTYLRHTESDGAIIITGSHIPPDRIGLIFMEEDGSYCSDKVCLEIESLYESYGYHNAGLLPISSVNDLRKVGHITNVQDVYKVYENSLANIVNLSLLQSKAFNMVVDPGNGTAASFFSTFLKKLGHKVTGINDSFAPVSDRLSEPIAENLTGLLTKMRSKPGVDLGVAFDVDADRATFVIPTEQGPKVISANEMGAVITKLLLEEGNRGEIILPINSSNAIVTIMSDYGIEPIYSKIGQPGTIEKVKKVIEKNGNPLFSYEESGKFYFLSDKILWTDGMLVVLKVIEFLIKKDQNLESLLQHIPHYFSIVDKIQLDDETMPKVKHKLSEKILSYTFPQEVERITIDGYRMQFDDGYNTWLLIRPSGTEPKIRLMADSKNFEKGKQAINLGKNFVFSLLQ